MEDDREVIFVDPLIDYSLDVLESDMNLYEFVLVRVHIKQICVLLNPFRGLSEDHKNEMKINIVTNGYASTAHVGIISVALKGVGTIGRKFKSMQELSDNLWLVDGRHRYESLTELCKKRKDWEAKCSSMLVCLAFRKDGEPLETIEILSIAAHLNEITGKTKQVDLADRVHAAVSTCRTLSCTRNLNLNAIEPMALAGAFHRLKTLGSLQIRQVKRYANLALKLCKSEKCREKFFSVAKLCPLLGISHVYHASLLKMEDEAFVLALDALAARINATRSGCRLTEPFEKTSKSFFQCFDLLYRKVAECSAVLGGKISTPDILDMEVSVTKTLKSPLRVLLCNQMSTFNRAETEIGQVNANKKRVTSLHSKLCKMFPGKVIQGISDNTIVLLQNHANESQKRIRFKHENELHQPISQSCTEALEPAPNRWLRSKVIKASNDEHPDDGNDLLLGEVTAEKKRGTKRRKYEPKHLRTKKFAGDRNEENGILEKFWKLSRGQKWEVLQTLENVALEADEGSRESSKFISPNDRFDDSIPVELPISYSNPLPYVWPEVTPHYVLLSRVAICNWPASVSISDKYPWLQAIHVPLGHRSYLDEAVTVKDLIATHHICFLHAGFVYCRINQTLQAVQSTLAAKSSFAPFSANENHLWVNSLTSPFAAHVFFTEQKAVLMHKGYCIMEGFLDDERVPGKIGTFKTPSLNGAQDLFQNLQEDMKRSLNRYMNEKKGEELGEWTPIINIDEDTDAVAGAKKVGRYATTTYGVTSAIEQNKERAWAVRSRALVDIRIAQVVSALGLWNNSNPSGDKMYMPKTGGRWLYTTELCERQKLHTDFPGLSQKETLDGTGNPGYFAICVGSKGAPLWVCEHSHRLIATTCERSVRMLSRGMRVVMVKIPPWSIFIGRGDIFHAGAAYDDSDVKAGHMRYHVYFIPSGLELPDGVYYHPEFNPRFKENSSLGTGGEKSVDQGDTQYNSD